MRRLLIGLGAFFFLLVTVVLAMPFFLPKEAIKRQVIAQVEKAVGWRLRLDGAVSLSLFPGFSLITEQVGLSGEAGADGIEFAKAQKIEFGLGLSGLFGGDIRVTGIQLVDPEIYLEIGTSGLTSWASRRDLSPAEEAAEILSRELTAPAEAETPAENVSEEQSDVALLRRIRIDELEIVNGKVVYHDKNSEQRHEVSALNLTLTAPDLAGEVGLESNFVWRGKPVEVSGTLTNPLGFAAGEQVPLDVLVAINETSLGLSGQAGLEPLQLNVAVSGSGPSFADLASLFGSPLVSDPGAFSIFANVAGNNTALAMSNLSASVGSLGLDGQVDADLSGAAPAVSGRLVLRDSSLEDFLKLAGKSYPASGSVGGDVSFSASGDTADALLATLNIKGKANVSNGMVSGLGLADAVGGDASADQINDIALEVTFNGLDEKASLNGGLSWRGEAFSITGSATPAPLIDGRSAPVAAKVKGQRFSAGFDGSVSGASGLMGAVSIETANLRNLLTWVGQPIKAGNGLGTFKASGLFSLSGKTIGFEETRFSLDETSGEANGLIVLGDRPKIEAKLALNALVLDPYLQAGANASSGSSNGVQSGAGQAATGNSGWSEANIDFSGLKAADVDFEITTKEIVWEKIKIDQSALTATIKDGILTANLNTLRLYDGQGSGEIRLNGQGATPKVSANFSLAELSAYPVLKAAADFGWLEGATNIALDVTASGASQRALIEALSGTASFNFADGAIRGLNIPKLVRGLSIETLLGWQNVPDEKTDFSTLSASFDIVGGVATNNDLTLIGPLVRMSGQGTTDMPLRTLDWRVEPKIVASLEGQAPTPRKKGTDKEMAGLGVPIVIRGSWDDPKIYPDIKGILENPEAAYQQLQSMGGELSKILKGGTPDAALVETANDVIQQATGGRAQIDIQKVIEGEVDDQEILKAVEEGFGLPSGLLGNFGRKKKE